MDVPWACSQAAKWDLIRLKRELFPILASCQLLTALVGASRFELETSCAQVLIAVCDGGNPRVLKCAPVAGFSILDPPRVYLRHPQLSWVIQPALRHKPRHKISGGKYRPVPTGGGTMPPPDIHPPLPSQAGAGLILPLKSFLKFPTEASYGRRQRIGGALIVRHGPLQRDLSEETCS